MKQEHLDRVRRRMIGAASALPLAAAAAGRAAAQANAWPRGPIRLIVPFSPGSITDTIARTMAEGLTKSLGQPLVVENKAGANGVLGAAEAARATPDGHTLLMTNSSSITINPQLYRQIPYQASDFAPITPIIESPFIIVVNAEWAAKNNISNLDDLLTFARTNPGDVKYGSAGPGNIAHLGTLMLSNYADVDTLHVPYKAGSLALLAVVSGEIEFMFDTWAGLPLIQSGKTKPLAVTAKTRMPQLPDVPTVEESGIPDFSVTFWLGMLAPVGTPSYILEKLSTASRTLMEDPRTRAVLSAQGNVTPEDPSTFARRIVRETAAWGEVIRRENLSLD